MLIDSLIFLLYGRVLLYKKIPQRVLITPFLTAPTEILSQPKIATSIVIQMLNSVSGTIVLLFVVKRGQQCTSKQIGVKVCSLGLDNLLDN